MKFDIEQEYQQYLKRVGLTEDRMHPIQNKETRQAFYAGIGALLAFQHDDLARVENEDEAAEILEEIFQQVSDYFETLIQPKS